MVTAPNLTGAHLEHVLDRRRAEGSLHHPEIPGIREILLEGSIPKIQDLRGLKGLGWQRQTVVRML